MTNKTNAAKESEKVTLKPYYRMGVSAWKAALQTGISYKSCKTYWQEFHDQLIEEEEKDIAIRQREVQSQFKTTFDDAIFNLNEQLSKISLLRKQHEERHDIAVVKAKKDKAAELPIYKPDKFLEDKFTELNKLLTDIAEKRAAALSAPYIDEETESATLKRLQERVKEAKKDA